MPPAAPGPEDLPPSLADAAAEQLLGLSAAEQQRRIDALAAEHPQHALALRRLGADLAGAAAMLDATFAGVRDETPRDVGGHRVERVLGEGAFGVVYLCRQERPVERDVAVKVLRPGAGDQRTLRRFGAERQVLATLNHPSITQVFDAGELPDGRPFFVMEYVDGAPIRAYCDRAGLPFAARLRLFLQLCRGVAHAHARGIVHRDLKPANVLVADGSDGPLVKIIDFGIAKALHATPTGDHPRTDPGRVVGTPGYMSPEQAEGRTSDVDARADVFALGVMLYELLTGALPWTDGAAVTDADPTRPSRRITESVDGAPPAALRQRAAELRGDVDWITLKALARDPGERYASVAELIADLERHLAGESVSAGPPALGYRLRKFARRHRAGLAVAASGVALVASLAAAFAYGSAKDAAVRGHFAEMRGVVGRLLQRADDPALFGTASGDAVRAAMSAEGLRLAEALLANAPDDPALQRDRFVALRQVSQMHWVLGEPTPARTAAGEAVRIAEHLLAAAPDDPEEHARVGEALHQLGRVLTLAGEPAAALDALGRAIAHLEVAASRVPDRHSALLASALHSTGVSRIHVAAGDDELSVQAAAVADYERAIAIYESLDDGSGTHADRQDQLVAARIDLADALITLRRFDDAQRQLERCAEAVQQVRVGRQRLTSEWFATRVRLKFDRGERASTLPDGEAAAAAAIAWRDAQPRRIEAHRLVARRLANLGQLRNYVEDFDGSSRAYRDAIAAAEELVRQFPDVPGEASTLVWALREHAYVLRDRYRRRDLAEAAACIERAIAVDDALPAELRSAKGARWRLLTMLAEVETSRGEARAEALWRDVAAILPPLGDQATNDLDHLLGAYAGVADVHVAAGELGAAERLLAAARHCIEAQPQVVKRLVEIEWLLARCAAARGDFAVAADCGERIAKARPTWFGYRRAGDCHRLAWRTATNPRRAAVHRDRAAEYYEQVVKALTPDATRHVDDPYYVLPWGFAQVHLAEIAADRGEVEAAAQLLQVALPALEAVRADAQADQWDEAGYRRGVALRESR